MEIYKKYETNKMTENKVEICKNCGHPACMHSNGESIGIGECFYEIGFDFEEDNPIFCSCKKFKKENDKKQKNL